MGGGSWSSDLHFSSARARRAAGRPDFAHDDDTKSKPIDEWEAHVDLDPKKIKDTINHVRESRDSAEHPESLAIAMIFDTTGSMQDVPKIFQAKLSKLMSFLLMKGGIEHPQILIGAINDATCDPIPFQVSQFESGNLIDDHLRKLVLVGGGGGHITESYELALYFAARLTSMDCLEKRGHKGYLFLSGDETPYPFVKRDEIERVFGIKEQADIPLEDIFNEVKEKFYTYYIMPGGTNHYKEPVIVNLWKKYLGQNVRFLEKPDTICEFIASEIAVNEGVPVAAALEGLKAVGADPLALKDVSKALIESTAKVPEKGKAKIVGTIPVTNKDSIKKL